MVDNVSLLSAFYQWARRRSLLLLILNCLSPGLLTHSYSIWSIVWSLEPQAQVGVSVILNR